MKTIIIGIAGGTGSGKTTLTEKLRDHFGANEVSVINHDSYYKRHDELPYEERCKLNYDLIVPEGGHNLVALELLIKWVDNHLHNAE